MRAFPYNSRSKRPGRLWHLRQSSTSFVYKDWFPPQSNVGYETLIYDCMIGDATLFQRADMVEVGLAYRAAGTGCVGRRTAGGLSQLRAGSAGPDAADKLLADDGGRAWRRSAHQV